MRRVVSLIGMLTLLAIQAIGQVPEISITNAANYRPYVAADSIAVIFGNNFSASVEQAGSQPLPTALAGARVQIIDLLGGSSLAGLFWVSPGQINFHVPADLGSGLHQVKVSTAAGTVFSGSLFVAPSAPGVFTVDRSGSGLAEHYWIRGGTADYLVIFGTGFGANAELVIPQLGRFGAIYCGAAPGFTGLDQINIPLPPGAINREVSGYLSTGPFGSNGFQIRP